MKNKNEKEIYKIIKNYHAISASEIASLIQNIDRATVYRILKRLTDKHIIKEIFINSGKTFYEIVEQSHHHHIICSKCKKIEPIVLNKTIEQSIKKIENNILSDLNFCISDHLLAFYGKCRNCI